MGEARPDLFVRSVDLISPYHDKRYPLFIAIGLRNLYGTEGYKVSVTNKKFQSQPLRDEHHVVVPHTVEERAFLREWNSFLGLEDFLTEVTLGIRLLKDIGYRIEIKTSPGLIDRIIMEGYGRHLILLEDSPTQN